MKAQTVKTKLEAAATTMSKIEVSMTTLQCNKTRLRMKAIES